MPVDAIGSVLSSTTNAALASQNNINETAFIKLFLSQLQFQDPLKPLDNAQFLTQLSQFVSVEQQTQMAQGIQDELALDSGGEALALLGHQVQVTGTDGKSTMIGTVEAINYSSSGAQLSIATSSGSVMTGVGLSQVSLVKP